VVANARLREEAKRRCDALGIELRIPRFALCTDNGAMVASLGAQLIMDGRVPSGLGFGADSTLSITKIQTL
jgi:N6-L-threonylcarbamoyladenine synthase